MYFFTLALDSIYLHAIPSRLLSKRAPCFGNHFSFWRPVMHLAPSSSATSNSERPEPRPRADPLVHHPHAKGVLTVMEHRTHRHHVELRVHSGIVDRVGE